MDEELRNKRNQFAKRCVIWFSSIAVAYSLLIGILFRSMGYGFLALALVYLVLGIPWAIAGYGYYKLEIEKVKVSNWQNVLVVCALPLFTLLIFSTPCILFLLFFCIGMMG